MPHRDGRVVWAQVMCALERDTAKEIILLNNVLEQRIRKRTLQREESNDDLREFAYSLGPTGRRLAMGSCPPPITR